MSADQAVARFTSVLNQLRAHDRFEAGRRVLALTALGALAASAGEDEAWRRVRNVSVHGGSGFDQAAALDDVAHRVERAVPELIGVFTQALIPDLLQVRGELPGLTALAVQTLEISDVGLAGEFGRWFDEALDIVSVGRHMGEFTTPRGLAALMARLAAPSAGQRVIDPSCGLGSVLARLGDLAPHLVLSGQDRSALAAAYGRLRLYLLDQHTDIRVEDALKIETFRSEETFDRVVCNPPFGQAGADLEDTLLKQRFPDIPFRYEALFLSYCQQRLAPNGRGVVAVPYPFLSRRGREADYRKWLVSAGHVEGIVALPSGVVSWTDVPMALIVLRERPTVPWVTIVDASFVKATGRRAAERLDDENVEAVARLYFEGGEPDRHARILPEAIFAAGGDLQPSRYLVNSAAEHLDPDALYATAKEAEARADAARQAFDRLLVALSISRDNAAPLVS